MAKQYFSSKEKYFTHTFNDLCNIHFDLNKNNKSMIIETPLYFSKVNPLLNVSLFYNAYEFENVGESWLSVDNIIEIYNLYTGYFEIVNERREKIILRNHIVDGTNVICDDQMTIYFKGFESGRISFEDISGTLYTYGMIGGIYKLIQKTYKGYNLYYIYNTLSYKLETICDSSNLSLPKNEKICFVDNCLSGQNIKTINIFNKNDNLEEKIEIFYCSTSERIEEIKIGKGGNKLNKHLEFEYSDVGDYVLIYDLIALNEYRDIPSDLLEKLNTLSVTKNTNNDSISINYGNYKFYTITYSNNVTLIMNEKNEIIKNNFNYDIGYEYVFEENFNKFTSIEYRGSLGRVEYNALIYNKLLKNGNPLNGTYLDGLIPQAVSPNEEIFNDYEGRDLVNINNSSNEIFRKRFNIKGLKDKVVSVILKLKSSANSSNIGFDAAIKFYRNNRELDDERSTLYSYYQKDYNVWNTYVFSNACKEDYDYFEVLFINKSMGLNCKLSIEAFDTALGNMFFYSSLENGLNKIVKIINNNTSDINYDYNYVSKINDIMYVYDEHKPYLIKKEIDKYGNEINYLYDNEDRIIHKAIVNGNFKEEISYSYFDENDGLRVIETTLYNKIETKYNLANKVKYKKVSSLNDEYLQEVNYNYNQINDINPGEFRNAIFSNDNNFKEVNEVSYSDKNLIYLLQSKKIINGIININDTYQIVYDSNNMVIGIKQNNYFLEEFAYNQDLNLEYKRYFNGVYKFEYDSEGYILTVKYGINENNLFDILSFNYDEDQKLTNLIEHIYEDGNIRTINKDYLYDEKNELKEIILSENNINFIIRKGNSNETKKEIVYIDEENDVYNVENNIFCEDIGLANNILLNNLLSKENVYETMFNEDISANKLALTNYFNGLKKEIELEIFGSTSFTKKIDNKKAYIYSQNGKIRIPGNIILSKSLLVLFKLGDHHLSQYITLCQYTDINGSTIYIQYDRINNKILSNSLTTRDGSFVFTNLNDNAIHIFKITYSNNILTISIDGTIKLYIDEVYQIENIIFPLNNKCYGILNGNFTYSEDDNILEFLKTFDKYNELSNNTDGFINRTINEIEQKNIDDILSFDSTLTSNNGLEPKIVECNNPYIKSLPKFVFDRTIERYVLFVNSTRYMYELPFSGCKSVSIFFSRIENSERTLIKLGTLSLKFHANNSFTVYKGNDVLFSSIPVTNNSWNNITIVFCKNIVSESLEEISYSLVIYYNGAAIYSDRHIEEQLGFRNFVDLEINYLRLGGFLLSNIIISDSEFGENEISFYIRKFNKSVRKINDYNLLGTIDGSKIIKDNNIVLEDDYCYEINGDYNTSRLSNLMKKYKNSNGENIYDNYSFEFNYVGKIKKVSKNNVIEDIYDYDQFGRLISHNDITYSYDLNGNILNIFSPQGNLQYHYNAIYKDRLDFITGQENVTIIYSGDNPFYPTGLSRNANMMTFSYEGRKISSINYLQNNYSFKYDEKGLRIEKKIVLNSGQSLLKQYRYDECNNLKEEIIYNVNGQNDILYYLWDESGIYGFIYNNYYYFYLKNIDGNIVGITDSDGKLVVQYKYNAFGKILDISGTLASTIGHINPIRYKGYYYDVETSLYYITSRYYDPEIGRFISPDSVDYLDSTTINGLNLYAYCNNDPVNYVDPTGHLAISALIGLIVASMIVAGGFQVYSNYKAGADGEELLDGVLGASLGAGVNTLILFTMPYLGGMELLFAAAGSALVQTLADATIDTIKGVEKTPNEYFGSFIKTTGLNFAGNLIGAKFIKTNPGWFKPQHFVSAFTKSYGTKILMQSFIGSGLGAIVNLIGKTLKGEYY